MSPLLRPPRRRRGPARLGGRSHRASFSYPNLRDKFSKLPNAVKLDLLLRLFGANNRNPEVSALVRRHLARGVTVEAVHAFARDLLALEEREIEALRQRIKAELEAQGHG